jgi:Peptidase propeptide and YPEB domain
MEDNMRKSIIVVAGFASAAVLAIAGIASANAGTGSRAGSTSQPAQVTTAISQADAERAAVAAVPGSTVTETKLDVDNGRAVWNVHLSTPNGPIEVKVDAETGAVRIDDDGAVGVGPDEDQADDDGDDDGAAHDANDDRGAHDANDDGPAHDVNDDHGHDANDDHGSGHGSDDGPAHS